MRHQRLFFDPVRPSLTFSSFRRLLILPRAVSGSISQGSDAFALEAAAMVQELEGGWKELYPVVIADGRTLTEAIRLQEAESLRDGGREVASDQRDACRCRESRISEKRIEGNWSVAIHTGHTPLSTMLQHQQGRKR
jgi:cell division protein YceG involved in septum cleavage